MSLSRRQAAAGLFAAAATLPAGRVLAQGMPSDASPIDETPTAVDAGRDAYEHMLAPVSINGQGPFQFLIDTGANVSCVSRAVADRLSLAMLEPARVHTVVGARDRPTVLIDHLQVGERSRKAVHAAAMPFNSGLDGVLGVDWLKGQRLELGFKAKSLSITKSKDDKTADGTVIVPAQRRLGQLTIVDADLSGRKISAMVDSGSQLTICNSRLRELLYEFDRRHGADTPYLKVRLESLVGESFTGEMVYLPFVRLGGLQLGNVPVVFADMHVFDLWGLRDKPAVVLGMDLLTQFDTVALDFGRSQVRFDLSETMRVPNKMFRPV
ncbi:MAG: retroviral-like aspartic protease family protein [Phenylobacterium sp.]